MEEEKKTTTKKVTPKKTETEKKNKKEEVKKTAAKKTTTKKATTTKKTTATKKTTKKAETKEEKETKKTTPRKRTVKKVEVENQDLEKTVIFDGTQSKNLAEVVNKLGEENVVLKNKVVKRSDKNKKIIVSLTVLIVAVMVGMLVYVVAFLNKGDKINGTSSFNAQDYEHVDEDDLSKNVQVPDEPSIENEDMYSNIKNITIDDFEARLVTGERMLAIISSETCYFCIISEEIFNDVLAEKDVTMYRLDITTMTDEEVDRLRSYYAFKSTPTVIAVENGQVVSPVEGSQSSEEFGKWVDSNTRK